MDLVDLAILISGGLLGFIGGFQIFKSIQLERKVKSISCSCKNFDISTTKDDHLFSFLPAIIVSILHMYVIYQLFHMLPYGYIYKIIPTFLLLMTSRITYYFFPHEDLIKNIRMLREYKQKIQE